MPCKSQCSYCPKNYLYSTTYRNHLIRSHPSLSVDLRLSPWREPDNATHNLSDGIYELDDGHHQVHQTGIEDSEDDPADSDLESYSKSLEESQDTDLLEAKTLAYEGVGV